MREHKFSIEEIKKLLKSMVILVDSREKKNKHILDYFKKQGISYRVEKLEYGDYSFMIPAAAAGEDIFFSPGLRGGAQGILGGIVRQPDRGA